MTIITKKKLTITTIINIIANTNFDFIIILIVITIFATYLSYFIFKSFINNYQYFGNFTNYFSYKVMFYNFWHKHFYCKYYSYYY